MHILSWPAIYSLELTPACNNRCPGCSNIYTTARTPAPIDAATWETWLVDFGPEAVQIRLTGGEPTLHPEFFRIAAAATSYDAQVAVFSNGRWADPDPLLRYLAGLPQFSGLLISLHGARPESHEAYSCIPGSFVETVTNIHRAVDRGIRVAISTVVTHHNWCEIEEVAALGQELGTQHVAFNRYLGGPLPGIEPSSQQLRSAIQTVERLRQQGASVKYGIGIPQCFVSNESEGCLAGVAYVAIDPWGHLHPCAHSPSLIGSLREMPLYDLWHSPAMAAWRALMPTDCTACAIFAQCHGGCRAIQELRPSQRDPLRGHPLSTFVAAASPRELPALAKPLAQVRLRPEQFGYVALGSGRAMPLRAEARPVIEACDGSATIADLTARFGQSGLELLGELWDAGMLKTL
jgi:AdoMet-dependent heme synthase